MRNRRLEFIFGLFLALQLLVGPTGHASNGAFPTSTGTRNLGRAGTDIGLADDATSARTNPAGLAYLWGNRLDHSLFAIDPWARTRTQFGRYHPEHNILIGSSVGTVIELGRPRRLDEAFSGESYFLGGEMTVAPWEAGYDYNWKFGFGVFPVTGGKTDYDLLVDQLDNGTAQYREFFSDSKVVAITPSVAWRLNEMFAVGASLDVNVGTFELDGPIVQRSSSLLRGQTTLGLTFGEAIELGRATGLAQAGNSVVLADVDGASSIGVGGRIGLYMNATENLSFGLVYHFPTRMQDYLGEISIDATDQVRRLGNGDLEAAGTVIQNLLVPSGVPFDPRLGYAATYDFRLQDFGLPEQVGFGLGYRFQPDEADWSLVFGLDVKWIHWRQTHRELKARLSNGDNPNLIALAGSRTIHARIRLGWRNQVVIATGLSLNLGSNWTFRMGYNWGESPVPEDSAIPTAPAFGEHHLGAGVTWRVGHWEFHVGVEHTFRNTLRPDKHAQDPGFDNSSMAFSMTQIGIGWTLHY